jgi:hypothetical protein
MSGKFIIMSMFWNDSDWLQASLDHVEYWEPDEHYICEGAWSKKYPARSTDGTREYIEAYQKTHKNVYIVDNIRDGKYRQNQASTCNLVLRTADLKPGDFIMYNACDLYYFKAAIERYRDMMERIDFDYPVFDIWNFWNSIEKYFLHRTKQAMNLPHRIVKGAKFIGTDHISVDGKRYDESKKCKRFQVPTIAFHYEGFREPDRIMQKYSVGDRQSPVNWNNGIKLRKTHKYTGAHPEFAVPVLKEKFFFEEI